MTTIARRSRYRGALLGLATGDAVGTTLEFQHPGSFTPLTDMVGSGPFSLQPGEWTDDTSMALCLAESLIECKGFNAHDQMQRYVRWWRDGYYSVKEYCFDIGNTVRNALAHFEHTGDPYAGSTDPYTAGNGSIMRLAPIPLAYANQPHQAIAYADDSSCTTHGAQTARDACRYLASLLIGALNGTSKAELLDAHDSPIPGIWKEAPLCPEIEAIAAGSYKHKQPPEIAGTGYVVQSLEAALWAFYHSTTFADGCLKAINLGNDADTTGAVYGQLAGAYYGDEGIPEHWRMQIAMRERIIELADGLYDLAESNISIT